MARSIRFADRDLVVAGFGIGDPAKSTISMPNTSKTGTLFLLVCAAITGCASPGNVIESPVENQAPPLKTGVYEIKTVDVRPRSTREIQPDVPFELRTIVGGTAVVLFTVRTDGSVTDASVVKADDILFGESAIAAILKWRFHPAQVNGAAVDCRMTLPFFFSSPYGYGQADGWAPNPSSDPPAGSQRNSLEQH